MINLSSLTNKKFVIFGMGITGIAVAKFLKKHDVDFTFSDDNEQALKKVNVRVGKRSVPPEDIDFEGVDALILSPGIPLHHPHPHQIVEKARCCGVPIICDIELLFQISMNKKFIGITGTNGKSTATALTSHILGTDSLGNIGKPVFEADHDYNDPYVLEVSSYQLDLLDKTAFDIAALINITPDHLDRHGGLQGYIDAKSRIFKQNPYQHAIINVDNVLCKAVYEHLRSQEIHPQIIRFSTTRVLADGVSIIDNVIYDNIGSKTSDNPKSYKLLNLNNLRGRHNAENIAVSYCIARLSGVDPHSIVERIRSFPGLEHRQQLVRQIEQIVFINDSKATNADATEKALQTYENIIWLAGGVAKDGGIASLEKYFPKLKHAIFFGECKQVFAEVVGKKAPVVLVENLEEAIEQAIKIFTNTIFQKHETCTILLSPAAASFDQWKNFEERGSAFVEYVKKLNVNSLHRVFTDG